MLLSLLPPKTGFLNNFVCFRKRGGSVDNLLDDLGDVIAPSSMTRESKKKSMSSKNLSLNSTRETSNAKAQQGQGATTAGAAAASGSLAATERITTVWKFGCGTAVGEATLAKSDNAFERALRFEESFRLL